jgi:hypothetical protein
MSRLSGPRRRWWGWLIAISYLFASMTPSLAAVVPNLPMQCAHEHTAGHEHRQADGELAAHAHDGTVTHDCDGDPDWPDGRHGHCCGSALCFVAVSPQAPSLVRFVAHGSRCEARPDLMGDEAAFGRRYRPPIA